MALNSLRTWVLGSSLVALLMLAAIWFFAVSPALEATAMVRAEAEGITASNEVRQISLVKLQKDYEQLPQLRADLATLRAAIPPTALVPDYLRQLQAVAAAHSVSLTAVQVQTPVAAVEAVPATTTAEATTSTEEPTTPTDGSTATTTTTPTTGLVEIPVTINVSGQRSDLDAFLSDVQAQMARLVVVTSVAETRSEDSESGTSYEDVLTGNLLVLPKAG